MRLIIPLLLGAILITFQNCATDVPDGNQGHTQSSSTADGNSNLPPPAPLPAPMPVAMPAPMPAPNPGIIAPASVTIYKFLYVDQVYYSTNASPGVANLQPYGSFKIYQYSPANGSGIPVNLCPQNRSSGVGYFTTLGQCGGFSLGAVVGYVSSFQAEGATTVIYGPSAPDAPIGITNDIKEITQNGSNAAIAGWGPN